MISVRHIRRIVGAAALAPSAGRLSLQVIPQTDRAAAAAVWLRLQKQLGAGLTNDWRWVETWLRHYDDVVRHEFVVALDGGEPVGVALLCQGVGQRRGPAPIRTLHLGTAGEPPGESVCVEYNRLLVREADRAGFAEAILRHVGARRLRWDCLELNGLAPEDAAPFVERVPGLIVRRRPCHVADLKRIRDENADLFSALRRPTGAKTRKSIRRLEEQFGPLSCAWAGDAGSAGAMLQELIPLHQQRWQRAGRPGVFASDRFTAFHHDLVTSLVPTGQVVLFRVAAGEQHVGTFYGFVDRGVLQHYQWGLVHFEESSLAPGFVVGVLCMQAALERGLDEVNWLAGDVRYKRELATAQHELVWAELHAGPWMAIVDGLMRARRRYRRLRRERAGSIEESS